MTVAKHKSRPYRAIGQRFINRTREAVRILKIKNYVSRWDYILSEASGKCVLHLCCIGITEKSISQKVNAMIQGNVLHAEVRNVCNEIIGIDYDEKTLVELRKRGFAEIIYRYVNQLEQVKISQTFDIILCDDLVKQLSQPVSMLEGIKRFMRDDSELLITIPNSFDLL